MTAISLSSATQHVDEEQSLHLHILQNIKPEMLTKQSNEKLRLEAGKFQMNKKSLRIFWKNIMWGNIHK